MSQDDEPTPLALETSGSSELVRRALSAAKCDLPSNDHVEAMLARFPFPIPPGDGGPPGEGPGEGGGGDGGPGPDAGPIGDAGAAGAAAGAGAKLAGAAALVALVAGATYLAVQSAPAPIPATVVPSASASSFVAAEISGSSRPVDVETSSATAKSASATAAAISARPTHAAASASGSGSASAPARSEYEILREATAAKKSNPSRALELVNEHASSYPRSGMAQEREMIRIEALLAQGKRAQARALADAFIKANPKSAYAQRLEGLFQ